MERPLLREAAHYSGYSRAAADLLDLAAGLFFKEGTFFLTTYDADNLLILKAVNHGGADIKEGDLLPLTGSY